MLRDFMTVDPNTTLGEEIPPVPLCLQECVIHKPPSDLTPPCPNSPQATVARYGI